MTSFLAVLAGVAFGLCGIPMALETRRTGSAYAVEARTGFLIVVGTLSMFGYVTLTYGFDLLLTANYLVEAGAWLVVIRYYYFPRRTK